MKLKKGIVLCLAVSTGLLLACSKETEGPATEKGNDAYILQTGNMDVAPYEGFATVYDAVPSGTLENNIREGSQPILSTGMRAFGKWIFKRTSLGKEGGKDAIVKFVLNDSGNLEKAGSLNSSAHSNYYVYDETTGFYVDMDRGLLKVQIFNPSTMQRTGEIDLTQLRNEEYAYQDVGTSMITAKEGKLYVDIYYNTRDEKGSFLKDDQLGFAELAVIDIATKKYEKTIRTNLASTIGYPGNENTMYALGDDGALYFCAHGFYPGGAKNSAIVRIKAGATDFDSGWVIKVDDYTPHSTVGTVCVFNGKLYTQIGSQPLKFQEMKNGVYYDYYVFDKENPQSGKKIEGIPVGTYTFQCAQSIIAMDGKVYFRTVDRKDNNGYYAIDGNGIAAPAFNVKSGGQVWGFAKLAPMKK